MSQPFLYIMFCTGRFFIYYQLLFMFLNMFAKHLDTGLCIVKTGAGNFICEVIWQTAVNPQRFISGILLTVCRKCEARINLQTEFIGRNAVVRAHIVKMVF